MKKLILPLFSLLFFYSANTSAQEDIDLFIEDMLTLAGNFAQPAADGAGYQASAGWFSSATALEKWDFRLSLHGNGLFVPSDQKNISLSNTDLGLLEVENAQSAEIPSAFGGVTDVYFVGEIQTPLYDAPVRFKAFDGVGRSYIAHAFAQAAVGMPFQSELTVRAMPKVTIDGVTASTIGVGLKHNLSQYFNRFNDPEGFQLALGIAYSKLNVEYAFEAIEVEDLLLMNLISVDADLWMLEAIGSKRWNNFEVFGAVGGTNSQFNYEMGGSGPVLGLVNSEIEALAEDQNQFKADFGFNYYYGRFRVSTMATVGRFFNVNLGLSVRI